MWLADKWIDYELLDCTCGEKLERWGQYILTRPDPQAIWRTPKEHPGWQSADAHYERSQSGGGRWSKGIIPDRWQVGYGRYTFNVSLMNFKHTGLFPEQAVNWEYITEKIHAADREISLLNLFAYTGGATIAAAAAGASVCHVDAARGMVFRAKENAESSGLPENSVRWIIDDCTKFVEREIRRKRRYDAVIMDPPSFGRGPSGEVWKLEDRLYDFVRLCSGVLSDNPLFVIINSYTTGLSPSTLTYITQSLLGGCAESRELGIPVTKWREVTQVPGGRRFGTVNENEQRDETSARRNERLLAMPCGATCRWTCL